MNEVLINALYDRVKSGGMKITQVPLPFRELVQELLNAN